MLRNETIEAVSDPWVVADAQFTAAQLQQGDPKKTLSVLTTAHTPVRTGAHGFENHSRHGEIVIQDCVETLIAIWQKVVALSQESDVDPNTLLILFLKANRDVVSKLDEVERNRLIDRLQGKS